jgi:hypothetical protein
MSTTTDYTIWPALPDVQTRLDAAGVTLRDKGSCLRRFQQALMAVTSEVVRTTKRQFLPASDVRLYDGTGTPEQEIDEIVSLTGVAVVGMQSAPGYTLSGVTIVKEQAKPQTRLVVARGSVPAFISEGALAPYSCLFPAGRQNIEVTGTFGYGATIPQDLWDAVCGELACRLASEALFTPAGRLSSRKVGDEEERYKLPEATDMEWRRAYLCALDDFKRPSGKRLRNLRPRMI